MRKKAMLYEKGEGTAVRCVLCAHRCVIPEDSYGFCGVRKNEGGMLYSLVYGETIARNVDPIEKKPLYHFLPGSTSYSIATIGCNFRCAFCQNWRISQLSYRNGDAFYGEKRLPEEIANDARIAGCGSIAYTYTEPTIFFEYAYDTCHAARGAKLANVFVTNGYMTAGAIDAISDVLDAANIDLKSFNDQYYRKNCRATLAPVLETIEYMKKKGIWIEITTLVVPGENDSDRELAETAGFIAGLDRNIPWHVSRFHPDYRFSDRPATSVETMRRAVEAGREAGLRYVYAGNIPCDANTYCPSCGAVIVERTGFDADVVGLNDGKCRSCGSEIAGRWR